MMYLLLLIGFLLLVKGADYFVEGSSKIAIALRIPQILIGLTLVAFGTSAPEASVSILAAIKGNPDISIGNIVGSNIFNIALIIGITAFINPLKVHRETIRKEIPFTILVSCVLLIMISDTRLKLFNKNLITKIDGFILLSFFSIFLYYVYLLARHSREQAMTEESDPSLPSLGKNIFYALGGLIAVVVGGDMVVRSSAEIAYSWGMSQTLVGLTIVAVGTSLPELITSVTAALKKNSEIALGNIVGSNIFNILFILGISSMISPIAVNNKIVIDISVMIFITILLWYFSASKGKISKTEGLIFLLIYATYMMYIIIRN